MSRGVPRPVRLLGGLITLILAVYVAHALTRIGGAAANTFFGTDVYQVVKALSLAVIVVRVIRHREDRLAFGLLALGFALNLAGDVAWGILLREMNGIVSVPSVADVLYIASYVPFSLAAALIVRESSRGSAGSGLWLDGIVAGLTLTTVMAYEVLPPLIASWQSQDLAATVTNALDVFGDALVTATLLASLAVRNWRIDLRSGLLALTFAAWVCADAIYLVQVADGTYVPAGILDVGWIGAAALAGLAAWVPARSHRADPAPTTASGVIPSLAGCGAIVLLLVDHFTRDTAWLVVPVGVIALLIFLRFSIVSADHRHLIRRTRQDAVTDSVTGLANRRALLEDLDRPAERERTLVLFDLDGFKTYNDTFGHPAGDAMLQLVARALARELGSDGVAYRLGGDEFCALVTGATDPEMLGRRLADAMEQSGSDYWIGASFGAAVVPAEERAGSLVLAHADGLLYADKRARQAARAGLSGSQRGAGGPGGTTMSRPVGFMSESSSTCQ